MKRRKIERLTRSNKSIMMIVMCADITVKRAKIPLARSICKVEKFVSIDKVTRRKREKPLVVYLQLETKRKEKHNKYRERKKKIKTLTKRNEYVD